jgi:chorismate mutase
MSPLNKKKLNTLRKKLDNLDNRLLNLIKKRSNLVNEVLKVKIYKKEIIDKKRIKIILSKIRKNSIKKKIDINITNRIWKNMIWAFIGYEKRNFKKK